MQLFVFVKENLTVRLIGWVQKLGSQEYLLFIDFAHYFFYRFSPIISGTAKYQIESWFFVPHFGSSIFEIFDSVLWDS